MPAAVASLAQPQLHQPGNPELDRLPVLAKPVKVGPLSPLPRRLQECLLRVAQGHPFPAGTGGVLVASRLQRACRTHIPREDVSLLLHLGPVGAPPPPDRADLEGGVPRWTGAAVGREVDLVGDQEKCNDLITKSAELRIRTGALDEIEEKGPPARLWVSNPRLRRPRESSPIAEAVAEGQHGVPPEAESE